MKKLLIKKNQKNRANGFEIERDYLEFTKMLWGLIAL